MKYRLLRLGIILLATLMALTAVAAAPDSPATPLANAGWEEIGVGSASGGGISNNSGDSWFPSLAVGPDGVPIVAWSDKSSGNYEIYVRRWNGVAWLEMGNGSATGGGISVTPGVSIAPSLAIAPDGKPVVAWQEGDYEVIAEIFVRRWNGSAWVEMGADSATEGGISNSSGYSFSPSLAIASNGATIIAWDDDTSGNREIYARRWNGAAWVEMGIGSASGGGVSNNSGDSQRPSLAIDPDGMPILAWINDAVPSALEIYVRKWNGLNWIEMDGSAIGGGVSNNNGLAGDLSLAVTPEGMPIVTWDMYYYFSDVEIYVRRWSGSSWIEMGNHSASGEGISNNPGGASAFPSLTISPDGVPLIAWNDDRSVIRNIYVLRWNGSGWVEMGNGSASGGGISNTSGDSALPSLTVTPDGAPIVAWQDVSNANSEIYVRRYQSTCYSLSRNHSGQGSNPLASPAQSDGCGAGQYTAGETITLSASPAVEWRVAGWSGTGDDSSTNYTNTVIMPHADHTVSVTYEPDETLIDCNSLSLSHTGQGSDPTASPAGSSFCTTGLFTPGELVGLTAAPAIGWHVSGWSGTNNNTSTALSNSLTMPANHHEVSVTYEPIPVETHYLFAPAILYRPVTCFPWPDEQEPNDDEDKADGPLCNGQTYTGLPTDTFDVFYIDTSQTGDVAATVDNHAGGGVQVSLHHQAITPNPLDLDYDPDDGFHVGSTNAAPGRYFIVIHAATSGPATPYTLRVTFATR